MKKIIASIVVIGLMLAVSPVLAQPNVENTPLTNALSLDIREQYPYGILIKNSFLMRPVKCPDFDTVYALAGGESRFTFPNEKVFFSWNKSFSGIREISCDMLMGMPLLGVVKYRSGSRLIKLKSTPKVYAIQDDGLLRPIKNEAQAIKLYGNDWAKRVDDLPGGFFSQYTVGEEIKDNEVPAETMVQDGSSELFQFHRIGEESILVKIDTYNAYDWTVDLIKEQSHNLEDMEQRFGFEFGKITGVEYRDEGLNHAIYITNSHDIILENFISEGFNPEKSTVLTNAIVEIAEEFVINKTLISKAEKQGKNVSQADNLLNEIDELSDGISTATDEFNIDLAQSRAEQILDLTAELKQILFKL